MKFTNQSAKQSAAVIEKKIIDAVLADNKFRFNMLQPTVEWLFNEEAITEEDYNLLTDWDLLNEIFN